MSQLTERVLAKDPAAVLLAGEMGPRANAELVPLTTHADAKVRRIALNCLIETGGPEAIDAFLASLGDEDPQVRGSALRGLDRHATRATVPALVNAYGRATDAYVRQQLALLFGKIGAPLADAQRVCRDEKDAAALEGCLVARAWLGEHEAQEAFAQRLLASRQQERARWLDYAGRIRARWLIRPLIPVLDDLTPLIRIGVDARPDLPDQLRAADIAVNLIAAIAERKFSFPVADAVNYTPAQIAEVRTFAQTAS